MSSRVRVLALALLAAGPAAGANDAWPPRGQVIEKVACQGDSSQTYALYLPSRYDPVHPSPILYAFDPRARGRVPVELFSAAAERLGYIVVGSNNSRNGPSAPIVAALNAVWTDTHARFVLDPKRIYATGMSGGNFPARLLLAQAGAGMIACAGAFVPDDLAAVKPHQAWLATAGFGDFNFDLNRSAVRELAGRGVVTRLASFDGGHAWPPEDVASRALDWLELSAMRAGNRPSDPAFVQAQLETGLARGDALIAAGRAHDAADEKGWLARELAGLVPEARLQTLAAEAEQLRESAEAKKARKREQSIARDERSRGEELRRRRWRLEQDSHQLPMDSETLAEWDPATVRREIDALLKAYARDLESTREERRVVAQRVIDGFYIDTLYRGQQLRDEGRLAAAQTDLEICVAIRPKLIGTVYELARVHAARGQEKEALAQLRKAKELGFGDLGRLATDPEWARLRERPEFRALVGN